jgi:hypothetical protein
MIVKQAILAKIYGGDKDYNKLPKTKWIIGFEKKINAIHQKITKIYPKEYEQIKQRRDFNIKGSLLSSIACHIENEMLDIMIDQFKFGGMGNYYVKCFDGLMVPKDISEECVNDTIIKIEDLFR